MAFPMASSKKSLIPLEGINFPLCLAPMVGLTHVALRELVRSYLPEDAKTIWPTEMLSSWRIPKEVLGVSDETKRSTSEDFLVPQILGNEEEPIAISVAKLEQWGAVAIDINMGCPVKKALKHNYGVSLMGDAKYAAEVVRMTVRNTSLPVSVKLRAGVQSDYDFLKNFVGGLADAGASWVCLHPRTAEQKRRGSADWEQIEKLKRDLPIGIIGNGDIQTIDDAFAMLEQTRCNMVMSGRALAARPWMLWQMGEKLGFKNPIGKIGLAPQTPEEEAAEYGRAVIELVKISQKYFTESSVLRRVRFYIRTTSVWLDFGHALVCEAHLAKSSSEMLERFEIFFQRSLAMSARTQLRQ